jgi:uncharacterized protein (TIGR00251 family)
VSREEFSLDDLDPVETASGTRLRLRVRPGARRNALLGTYAGALKLSVTAPPEKGKANRAVLTLLAHHLDLPPSSLELIAGETSRDKTIVIPLPPTELITRLKQAPQ